MLNDAFAISQSEESLKEASDPLIDERKDTEIIPGDTCVLSRKHFEECSMCSRHTFTDASDLSQVTGFEVGPTPDWPAPILKVRPDDFPVNLKDTHKPQTPEPKQEDDTFPTMSSEYNLNSASLHSTTVSSSSYPSADFPSHYVQLLKNSPRLTYLPTLTKMHPNTQVLHPLIYAEAATQTDISDVSNGVSCLTTVKLLLGVALSAIGFVIIIFIMKCKFGIGFQMNMCYYI